MTTKFDIGQYVFVLDDNKVKEVLVVSIDIVPEEHVGHTKQTNVNKSFVMYRLATVSMPTHNNPTHIKNEI